MNKYSGTTNVSRIIMLLGIITLIGCVPPKTLRPERIAEIRKVGIITNIPENEFKVLDHTGTMKKSYTYGQFGALGALVESAILLGVREYKISKSINGNLDEIKGLFNSNLIIKHEIDSTLAQKIRTKYTIVEPQYFDTKKLSFNNKFECFVESKKIGIDTLVFLDIAYGLAAYNDKPASVTIDGQMIVYNVTNEEIVLKMNIESDQDFRAHRTVEDFTKENGKLLKEDLNGAVNGFSSYVARQLGAWQ